MPKFNMYQSLHTTVIGPEGLPLEIQIRTREMHDMAEYGVAAHWMYKAAPGGKRIKAPEGDAKNRWLRSMLDWQQELSDPKEFVENLKVDLFDEEVFVFTPEGRGASRSPPARRRWTSPTRSTPSSGHRCVGAKVNGKIVPLTYQLRSGDRVEVLTEQARPRPLARLAGGRQDDPRPQQDQAVLQGRGPRRTPSTPAASCCRSTCARRGCRRRRSPDRRCWPTSSARWASARPTTSTSRSAGRRSARRSSSTRSSSGSSRARRPSEESGVAETLVSDRRKRRMPTGSSGAYGIRVEGVEDVMLRLAKCCHPVPGRPDRRLRLARPRDHDPPRRLPERRGAAQGPRALRRRPLGGRARERLQGRDPGRRLRPPPPARGSLPHARRGRASTSSRPAASSPARWSATASSSRSATRRS